MIRREEFYYDSRDHVSKIHAVKWMPEEETPVLILQVIHGMAEYAQAYQHFAEFLAQKGILVVAEDHLGHGDSVSEGDVYGYFAKNDPATVAVRDVHRLKKMIQGQYPGIPYYILGHSMGSFMLRNYLCRYGKGIDGALILGTGNQPKLLVNFAKCVARFLAIFQGWKHKSAIMNALAFSKNNSKIENPRTIFDWLTKEEERVDRYMEDPKSGFTFTLNGFYTLFDLIARINKIENLEKMPKDIPIWIASGTEDPVGDYGEGVRALCETYRQLGMKNVELKLYEGDRHELINETDRKAVYEDVYRWIMKTESSNKETIEK